MYRQEDSSASIGLARSWNCAVLETCLGVGGIAPIVAEQSHTVVADPVKAATRITVYESQKS